MSSFRDDAYVFTDRYAELGDYCPHCATYHPLGECDADFQEHIDSRIDAHERFLMSEGADHLFEGRGE